MLKGRIRDYAIAGLLVALAMVPNIVMFREAMGTLDLPTTFDWWLLREATSRPASDLYDWGAVSELGHTYSYRYSPLLPILFQPVVALGLGVWRVAHLAMLVVLPWTLIPLVLVAGPFWYDLAHGNFMTLTFVLAWLALSGNRFGQGAFFGLFWLVPRPLMVPIGIWLIWKRPESRSIALVVTLVAATATLLTGAAVEWGAAILRGGDMLGAEFDWGPYQYLGSLWIPLGIVLGAWLTIRGNLGLAALAVSPYWVPYHLLALLWEVRGRWPWQSVQPAAPPARPRVRH